MELRLTRRQREVAELAARGLTNREIAQALFISERTAEGHIQTLFNVLTVNTRTQLATWWVRQQVSAGAAEKGADARPVALLACDLVPTPSSDELPADEGQAVRHFAELVLEQVVRRGGREVVTSQPPNRRLAVFDAETDAAAAALGVQQAVAKERMRGQDLPHVRAALHSATLAPTHAQLSGPALETCVRLLETAHARQVLVSDAAAPGLAGKTPEGARLLGPTKRLQPGLAEPLTCFQLVDGEDRLWVTRLRPLDRSLTNLPVPLTTFVNRQRELAELNDLHARYRLVTLDGVGGGGKTRLALQFGSRVLDDYADGVWLVELAAIGDARLVLQALAVALGVREPAGRPLIDAILEHLGRRRLLLILDNCEHLLDAAAHLVRRVLTACSEVQVLATSRERLGVPGELTYRVQSLPHPRDLGSEGLAAIAGYDSVQLFVDRARANEPDFQLTEDNAPTVGSICARLDGIPLAIELAASWTRSLGVLQLLENLDDRFGLLTRGPRTAPPRQQTLLAAIEWSHNQLSEAERRLFRRLGVFAGSFGLADVEAICGHATDSHLEALILISGLVDKSLVMFDMGSYRCLDTVRQYARQRLEAVGELETFARRHAEHFAEVAMDRTPGQLATWLARLDQHIANLQAALDWSLRQDSDVALRIAGAMFPYWQLRGRITEARQFLEALVRATADTPGALARSLTLAAGAAYLQNDVRAGATWIAEALAFARSQDPDVLASALRVQGQLAVASEDLTTGEASFEEALSLCRETGSLAAEAQALHDLAQIAGLRYQLKEAQSRYTRSLELRTRLGIREEGHVTLTFLALLQLLAHEVEAARPALREGLASARRLQDRRAAWALDVRACLAGAEGDARTALVMAGAAAAMHRASGTTPPPIWARLIGTWLDPARAALLPSEAHAAWDEGSRMDFDAALRHALAD
jgi:predicted ATPase/DNA-binding CsgD family transcriptional regulator